MEWLNRKNEFADRDLKLLQFCPEHLSASAVETIKLSRGGNDSASVMESQSHKTEKELWSWVERVSFVVAIV